MVVRNRLSLSYFFFFLLLIFHPLSLSYEICSKKNFVEISLVEKIATRRDWKNQLAAEGDRAGKSSASTRQFTSNKALVGDSRSGVGGNQVQSTR